MSESHRERQKRPSQTRVLATPTIALNLHPTTRQDSICVTAFPPYCSRDGCADKHNEDNELTLHRAALLLFTGKQATSVCTSCLTTAYSSIKTNTSNKNSLLIYHRGPHSCKRIHFAMYRFNCVLRPTNFSQSGSIFWQLLRAALSLMGGTTIFNLTITDLLPAKTSL